MILSNFKFISFTGNTYLTCVIHATVDVTYPVPFWKFWDKPKVKTRKISKAYFGNWFFTDTGEYTPGKQAANLFRSYEAQHGKVFK